MIQVRDESGRSAPAAAAGPVWLIPHLPKCAGSTVELHLRRHLGPAGFWSPGRRSRSLPLELFGRKYDARPPVPPDGIHAVSGHFLGASVARLFPGREARAMLLLREPGALVLSWYNYRMMRYRAAGQAGYPFALHLRALPVDPMAHFLLERWGEQSWARLATMGPAEKARRLAALLGGFAFVGDIARADEMIAGLSRGLGIPERAEPENTGAQWQAATGWQPLRLADLTEAERAALAARTRLDAWVWERFAMGRDRAFDAASAAPFLRGELARPFAELARRRHRAARAA